MYAVDDKDTVRVLHGLPQSSVGAPLPVVLSDEHRTLIAYHMDDRDPEWDGKTVRVVGTDTDDEPVAILRIVRPRATMFGPPNDEAFSGHPLASRGLKPYRTFEVLQSSWIRGLERMNSVHPYHRPQHFADLRHFILAFHDSTFECIGTGIEVVELFRGSMNDAIAKMARIIAANSRHS